MVTPQMELSPRSWGWVPSVGGCPPRGAGEPRFGVCVWGGVVSGGRADPGDSFGSAGWLPAGCRGQASAGVCFSAARAGLRRPPPMPRPFFKSSPSGGSQTAEDLRPGSFPVTVQSGVGQFTGTRRVATRCEPCLEGHMCFFSSALVIFYSPSPNQVFSESHFSFRLNSLLLALAK